MPKVWNILSNLYKNMDGLDKFKTAIKQWKSETCPGKVCKKYIPNIGYI